MSNLPKFTTLFTLALLCSIAVVLYLFSTLDSEKEVVYFQSSNKLKDSLNNEKKLLEEIGLNIAISISENKKIVNALLTHNRKAAIKELEKISIDFKERTGIKDLKVHIHTNETRSFVRNWKLNKFGDDLSGFRKAILKVKETQELVFGFETGRMGLTLRSIVPIMHKNKFIGSLEFIQSFENIREKLKKKNSNYLLLMDKSLLPIATYLKDAPTLGNSIVSLKDYDKEFLEKSKNIDFDVLEKNGYLLTDDYLFTFETIKNTRNQKVGQHLLAISTKNVNIEIDKLIYNTQIKALIAVLSLFFFIGLVFMLIALASK